jgi:hypothetical protein
MSNLNHIKPIVVTGKAGFNRLVQAGFIAAIVATAANLLVYYLVPALFNFTLAIPLQGPGSEIEQMPAVMVILATAVPAIGATILLALLYRFTARPRRIFQVIALLFLLLSFLPPFSLPVALNIRLTLALMHVIAGGVIIYVLTVWAAGRINSSQ